MPSEFFLGNRLMLYIKCKGGCLGLDGAELLSVPRYPTNLGYNRARVCCVAYSRCGMCGLFFSLSHDIYHVTCLSLSYPFASNLEK